MEQGGGHPAWIKCLLVHDVDYLVKKPDFSQRKFARMAVFPPFLLFCHL
jgi:hypothetical protein